MCLRFDLIYLEQQRRAASAFYIGPNFDRQDLLKALYVVGEASEIFKKIYYQSIKKIITIFIKN